MASRKIIGTHPVHHASDFDLDIMSHEDDLFRWFLLCLFFGKPIQSNVAVATWKMFIDNKLDTPWAILATKHRRLVHLLDEGKYTRYDESTARTLHRCMEELVRDYDGSVLFMIESSASEDELDKRLQKLHGVGPKVAEIFMRETTEFFARRTE